MYLSVLLVLKVEQSYQIIQYVYVCFKKETFKALFFCTGLVSEVKKWIRQPVKHESVYAYFVFCMRYISPHDDSCSSQSDTLPDGGHQVKLEKKNQLLKFTSQQNCFET